MRNRMMGLFAALAIPSPPSASASRRPSPRPNPIAMATMAMIAIGAVATCRRAMPIAIIASIAGTARIAITIAAIGIGGIIGARAIIATGHHAPITRRAIAIRIAGNRGKQPDGRINWIRPISSSPVDPTT